jgi:hypothetical protein
MKHFAGKWTVRVMVEVIDVDRNHNSDYPQWLNEVPNGAANFTTFEEAVAHAEKLRDAMRLIAEIGNEST